MFNWVRFEALVVERFLEVTQLSLLEAIWEELRDITSLMEELWLYSTGNLSNTNMKVEGREHQPLVNILQYPFNLFYKLFFFGKFSNGFGSKPKSRTNLYIKLVFTENIFIESQSKLGRLDATVTTTIEHFQVFL